MTKRKHILVLAIGIGVLLLALLLWYWYLVPQLPAPADSSAQPIPTSGAVLSPLTSEAVPGVRFTAGDTTIETGSTGQFRFGVVDPGAGIMLSHGDSSPGLEKSGAKKSFGSSMTGGFSRTKSLLTSS